MSSEILDNLIGAIHDIHISPVDPWVIGLQSRVEEIVACTGDRRATWSLCGERMAFLDTHLDIRSEVLLHDSRTPESNLLLHLALDAVQLRGKNGKCVVLAVTNEEGQIDKFMRVRQLVKQVEVFLDVGGRISQRGKNEHALAVRRSPGCGLDGVEVYARNGARVHFVGFVVVEDDGCLSMGIPLNHFVDGHFHWRLGGTVAVETIHKNGRSQYSTRTGIKGGQKLTSASQMQTC